MMVARGAGGETRAFPVVETVHRDSICWVTEAPAAVSSPVAAAAAQMAEAAVSALAGALARVGVWGLARGCMNLLRNPSHSSSTACTTELHPRKRCAAHLDTRGMTEPACFPFLFQHAAARPACKTLAFCYCYCRRGSVRRGAVPAGRRAAAAE